MKSQKIKTLARIIIASMLIVILGISSVITTDAASVVQTVYANSGITAKATYNNSTNNNGTVSYENNINKNSENIIVIGDSRTCQLLNLDKKTKKNRISGFAAWGQTYNRNYSFSINNKTKKVVSNTYTADTYIKSKLIKPALSSSKPCNIWVFGTINETYGDKNATKLISYVKELRNYCVNTNKNKKVTIHVVRTVVGTSNWSAANSNVSAYNKAIDNAFSNGKENKSNVTIVTTGYSTVITGTSAYCNKKYFSGIPVFGYTYTSAANAKTYTKDGKHGTVTTTVNNNNKGYDSGLHYAVNTLECMGNWIINNSKK